MIQSSAYLLFACAVLGLSLGCQIDERDPTVGSETHFLSWCSADGSCAVGLECICGACARSCDDGVECGALASGATCVSVQKGNAACSDAEPAQTCEVACGDDTDCLVLSPEHHCDIGHCRRLSSECQRGETEPAEVVFMGDNFLANSGQIAIAVQSLAREAGSLEAEASYRDFSSTLTTPFGGNMDLGTQVAAARDEGPVRIVVLDAGGPDALLNCPEPVDANCPALMNAVQGFAVLLDDLEQNGATGVVAFFYPDPEDATLKSKFDALRPLMKETCEAASFCSFLDLRATFGGHEDEYLLSGGILPTIEGSNATAALLWSEMGRRCLGQ